VHREVGRKVRKAISDIGGKMPEDLPAEPSIKKVLKYKTKLIEVEHDDLQVDLEI